MRRPVNSILAGGLAVLLSGGLWIAAPAPHALAGERSLGELLKQLQSADTLAERMRAAEGIAEYGPSVVPRLLPLLDHPDPRTQEYACLALVRLGPEAEAAVPSLIRQASRRDCVFRRYAIFALHQIGPPAAPAVPALIGVLTEDAPDCRLAAAEALAGIGQAAVPALIETLRRPDPRASCAACLTLQQLGAQAVPAIPALLEAVAAPDESLRDEIFMTLAGFGGDAVEPLARLLDSPEPGLRRRAALTLGRLQRTAHPSEAALGKRTQDSDASVRFWAVRSLAAIGAASPATRQYLLQAVGDSDPNVRWQALTSLASVAPELARQAARDLLDDPHPSVRKQAQAVAEALDPERA